MKLIIKVVPAEFDNGFMSVKFPYTPLYNMEHDVKNKDDLKSEIESIKSGISENSVIFLDPIGRKFNGFDKWEASNKELLKNRF